MKFLAGALIAAAAYSAAASWNVETYRLFGPEHPGGYMHPASITQLDNGDLYVSYYGGAGEYSDDTAVYGSRASLEDMRWTFPEVIADTPNRGEGNPVVWQAPDGLVYLWYNIRYGDTWSNARVKGKISYDGAKTWSDSYMLTLEEGTMCRSQPIVLDSGEYLLPLYYERGEDREQTTAGTASFFMKYNPETKEWSQLGTIGGKPNLQAQVAQIEGDHLVAYIRRAGDFLPTDSGYTLRSESMDGGVTWSDAVDTEFKNPNSAVDFIKLANGHHLLVYNDNMNERTPLSVAISTDGAKTFPKRRDIGGGYNTFAYPYAIQLRDGKIAVLYTTNGRTTIMLSIFEEEAIGDPPSSDD